MRGGGVLTRWIVLQVPAPALSAGGPGAETHLPAAGGEPWSPRNLSYHIFTVLFGVLYTPQPRLVVILEMIQLWKMKICYVIAVCL